MKIGLIGAENFHSKAFSTLFNEKKIFDGFSIDYICGDDDPAKCEALMRDYNIACRCENYEEVIEKADAVMITYRRGSMHAAPAIAALRAGKPAFVDKPFTADSRQAEEIIAAAEETGTPFCGGSTLKVLPVIQEIRSKIKPGTTVTIDYNADPNSPFDGFFFYSPHAVELAMLLCGEDCETLSASRSGSTVVTNLLYPDHQCVLITSPVKEDLHIRLTTNVVEDFTVQIGDAYRYGAEEFVEMVRTGRPARDYAFYRKAVALTEEIVRAYEANTAKS